MKLSRKHKRLICKAFFFGGLYMITFGMIATTIFITPRQYNLYAPIRIVIVFFATVLLSKYLFYMIASPWHDAYMAWTRRYWRLKRPNYHPKVSALIPAWNEEVGILSTINSLLGNTYDNMEIVVVNDGSTDNSDALIRGFKKKFDGQRKSKKKGKSIVYHYQPNGGKGKALNTAVSLASGDILLSIDADCIVDPEAVTNFVECFRNPKVMAAVGNVQIGSTKKIIGLIQSMEFLFSFYFKKADSLLNTIYIIGGAAGAFRREVFEKLGGITPKTLLKTSSFRFESKTQDIESYMQIMHLFTPKAPAISMVLKSSVFVGNVAASRVSMNTCTCSSAAVSTIISS